MSTRSSRLDWLLFALLGLAWGSSYLLIRIGVVGLPPFTLIASRLLIGAVLLGVAFASTGERLPRQPRVYGHVLAMAVLNIVVPFWLTTWGEQSIDSSLASILNSTIPLFTIVFAALALHDEPITINRLAGLGLGFAGIVILVGPSSGAIGSSLPGQLALVGSSISYALGIVYARRMLRTLAPLATAFLQVAMAMLVSAALALAIDRPFALRPHPDALVAVAGLGAFASGFAYLWWYRLLRDWGSTRSSLVAYTLPVVGIVLGVAFGGETLTISMLFGAMLVVGGVALVSSPLGPKRAFGPRASASASGDRTSTASEAAELGSPSA